MELKTVVLVTALVFFFCYEAQSGEIVSQLDSRQLRGSFEVCPLVSGTCPAYIEGEEQFHPYPGNVTRYCQCAHGTPVAMDCPLV
ncbi:unnamed protein product [Allacma fusca]|uniref:Uncharacterized protein n=1 Tax=Allacma fusca TaxID=39272 RepID=A0A8J2KAN2_9HEXA|nr:unnamed protein product [Allacma fusca]